MNSYPDGEGGFGMREKAREEISHLREGLAAAADLVAAEFEGFPEDRLDFTQDEPVWARWSADTQLRHMTCVPCRWLHGLCRKFLEARGHRLPEMNMDSINAGTGRHIPPEILPDVDSLIAFMRQMHGFCIELLDKETPESLRELKCLRVVDTEAWREDAPEKPIDLWRMLAKLHPYGVQEDPKAPGNFPMELIAVIRQIYWETLAHLRTVQRLKGLLDLPVKVSLPREGYLTISKFYD